MRGVIPEKWRYVNRPLLSRLKSDPGGFRGKARILPTPSPHYTEVWASSSEEGAGGVLGPCRVKGVGDEESQHLPGFPRRGLAGAFRPLREPESDVRFLQRQGLPSCPAKICAHQLGMWLWDGAGSLRPQSGRIPPIATAGEKPTLVLGKIAWSIGCFAFRLLAWWAVVVHSSRPEHPPSLGALQVGEDVPDARKCACASHVAKVAEFFQVCQDRV